MLKLLNRLIAILLVPCLAFPAGISDQSSVISHQRPGCWLNSELCALNAVRFTSQALAEHALSEVSGTPHRAFSRELDITSVEQVRREPNDSFRFEPRVAVYPGGLDVRIFKFFPNLERVHYINRMPFRVPYDIDRLHSGVSPMGQEAFNHMMSGYLSAAKADYIGDHVQELILGNKRGAPQIGFEPFIIADLKRSGAQEIHVEEVKEKKSQPPTFTINFRTPDGKARSLIYTQADIHDLTYSDALEDDLRTHRVDLLFFKAFTNHDDRDEGETNRPLPKKILDLRPGALFVREEYDRKGTHFYGIEWKWIDGLTRIGFVGGSDTPFGCLGHYGRTIFYPGDKNYGSLTVYRYPPADASPSVAAGQFPPSEPDSEDSKKVREIDPELVFVRLLGKGGFNTSYLVKQPDGSLATLCVAGTNWGPEFLPRAQHNLALLAATMRGLNSSPWSGKLLKSYGESTTMIDGENSPTVRAILRTYFDKPISAALSEGFLTYEEAEQQLLEVADDYAQRGYAILDGAPSNFYYVNGHLWHADLGLTHSLQELQAKGMDVYGDVKGRMRHGDLNELLRALWILKGTPTPAQQRLALPIHTDGWRSFGSSFEIPPMATVFNSQTIQQIEQGRLCLAVLNSQLYALGGILQGSWKYRADPYSEPIFLSAARLRDDFPANGTFAIRKDMAKKIMLVAPESDVFQEYVSYALTESSHLYYEPVRRGSDSRPDIQRTLVRVLKSHGMNFEKFSRQLLLRDYSTLRIEIREHDLPEEIFLERSIHQVTLVINQAFVNNDDQLFVQMSKGIANLLPVELKGNPSGVLGQLGEEFSLLPWILSCVREIGIEALVEAVKTMELCEDQPFTYWLRYLEYRLNKAEIDPKHFSEQADWLMNLEKINLPVEVATFVKEFLSPKEARWLYLEDGDQRIAMPVLTSAAAPDSKVFQRHYRDLLYVQDMVTGKMTSLRYVRADRLTLMERARAIDSFKRWPQEKFDHTGITDGLRTLEDTLYSGYLAARSRELRWTYLALSSTGEVEGYIRRRPFSSTLSILEIQPQNVVHTRYKGVGSELLIAAINERVPEWRPRNHREPNTSLRLMMAATRIKVILENLLGYIPLGPTSVNGTDLNAVLNRKNMIRAIQEQRKKVMIFIDRFGWQESVDHQISAAAPERSSEAEGIGRRIKLSAKLVGLRKSEKEVLTLWAQGWCLKEIASQRNGSVETVKRHLTNIRRKLQINYSQVPLKGGFLIELYWQGFVEAPELFEILSMPIFNDRGLFSAIQNGARSIPELSNSTKLSEYKVKAVIRRISGYFRKHPISEYPEFHIDFWLLAAIRQSVTARTNNHLISRAA